MIYRFVKDAALIRLRWPSKGANIHRGAGSMKGNHPSSRKELEGCPTRQNTKFKRKTNPPQPKPPVNEGNTKAPFHWQLKLKLSSSNTKILIWVKQICLNLLFTAFTAHTKHVPELPTNSWFGLVGWCPTPPRQKTRRENDHQRVKEYFKGRQQTTKAYLSD